MTVTDQIKILDKKIKQNESQYDLDRKAAKISALSSNNLVKYEYLTGEDLNYKPNTVEQEKYDYSPLSKFFNKRLKEEDKKEGLLKRLQNIEDKSEEWLKAIKSKNKNIKVVTDIGEEPIIPEAKRLIEEIKIIQKDADYRKLKITGGYENTYNFSDYKTFKELFRDLYYQNMTTDEAEKKQNELNGVLGALIEHSTKTK